MLSASKPWWQQATALVTLGAGGAVTGLSVAPHAVPGVAPSVNTPIRWLALNHYSRPVSATDSALRSAIVNVANYYLRMAQSTSPAEMEAIIWQRASIDGADHGASCAAFASLTLELGAQAIGQQSWVTGGTSYPWPLQKWADARVDANPASLGVVSIRQDALANGRWHPLGDGYQPLPGDWVVFDGHVEVVTKYTGGVLNAVGGDSVPNFSVNAHEYPDPLDGQGVAGFVDNGALADTGHQVPGRGAQAPGGQAGSGAAATGWVALPGSPADVPAAALAAAPGGADIPGTAVSGRSAGRAGKAVSARGGGRSQKSAPRAAGRARGDSSGNGQPWQGASRGLAAGADVPGTGLSGPVVTSQAAAPGAAAIPGLLAAQDGRPATPQAVPHGANQPAPAAGPVIDATAKKAFISDVAPGAVAAQQRYGVPAAVTIAQAIEESQWGRSELATKDNNLFGIKGTGPAGSDQFPTQEYENGTWVTQIASFRVYHSIAECIDDHGRLLASSEDYSQAMAQRQIPNAFAAALTGVYATDPGYGAKLIDLMRQYNLYRFQVVARAPTSGPAARPGAAVPGGAAVSGGAAVPGGAAVSGGAAGRAGSAGTAGGAGGAAGTEGLPGAAGPAGAGGGAGPGGAGAAIPGLRRVAPGPRAAGPAAEPAPSSASVPGVQSAAYRRLPAGERATSPAPAEPYKEHIPASVRKAFIAVAKVPVTRVEPLYWDVASRSGIGWELLAACDWMQCEARTRYSPVHGEKLGTVNHDGTVYRTKSQALEQCADDLVELAAAVYGIDLTAKEPLSIRDLARAFAAFRWGALLKLHRTSAMEFPYSVAGLTTRHMNMRWPKIDEPNAPDKPGARFNRPFGAVPVVLALNYPATV